MTKEFSFLSSNKENTIQGIMWIPEGEVKAILQIAHGMIEYIRRYDEFARFMAEHGFLVVGNDHLGHGRSVDNADGYGYIAREKGSSCIVKDMYHVTKIVKKEYPDVPYFLLGHSMGSFMTRMYMMKYGEELTGALLLGTARHPEVVADAAICAVSVSTLINGDRYRDLNIAKMMFGSYNARIKNAKTPSDWICSDPEVVEEYVSNPQSSFIFTNNGAGALFATLKYIQRRENIAKIPKDLPVFILAGWEDPVGNYGEGPTMVYKDYFEAGLKVDLKLYKGCRHELLNEFIKRDVYADILDWVEKRL